MKKSSGIQEVSLFVIEMHEITRALLIIRHNIYRKKISFTEYVNVWEEKTKEQQQSKQETERKKTVFKH